MEIGVINPDFLFQILSEDKDWPKSAALFQFEVEAVHGNLTEIIRNNWLLPQLGSWWVCGISQKLFLGKEEEFSADMREGIIVYSFI